MDKKDWTPEELELKEALNKLYETDTRTPSKPLDLSFMDEPVQKKKIKRRRCFAYIAAAVLLVFASSFATAIFISNDYASAVQDKIQRKVFEMKHGVVVATDAEFTEEGETVWEITDFETAVKAKELIPELPIPEYMPEGYVFSKLVAHIYNDGNYMSICDYTSDDNNTLSICSQPYSDEQYSSTSNNLKTLKLHDRTIILWQDFTSSLKGATIILDNTIMFITPSTNNLSSDQLLLIATKLK